MVYTVVWKTVMKVSKCETNDPLKDVVNSSHTGDFNARACKCHCLFLMLTWSSDKLYFPCFIFLHIICLKPNLFHTILFSVHVFYLLMHLFFKIIEVVLVKTI